MAQGTGLGHVVVPVAHVTVARGQGTAAVGVHGPPRRARGVEGIGIAVIVVGAVVVVVPPQEVHVARQLAAGAAHGARLGPGGVAHYLLVVGLLDVGIT